MTRHERAREVRQVLRLRQQVGLSIDHIARERHLHRTTVIRWLKAVKSA